jgi:dimeric dUTPase (all-alpha-NTP-PPase superfamily)
VGQVDEAGELEDEPGPAGAPRSTGADKLDLIFEWQQRFQDDLVARRGIDYDQRTWIQKQALALMVELGEVLEAAQFKWWKNPGPWDEAHLHEELVDVLHFYVAMCLAAGMTAEDLYQGYLTKNRENFRRQQGLSDRADYQSGAD